MFFDFVMSLRGNLNSRNQKQLFAHSLDLLRLRLNYGLKDPGILDDLVDIQFGFLDRTLVLQKYPVLVLVKHSGIHANSAIALKHLTHDVRRGRSIVNLLHVDERFLEARLALNRDEIHTSNAAYADDVGEDSLDAGLIVLCEHAGDEEAEGRHVDLMLLLLGLVLYFIELNIRINFPTFCVESGNLRFP